MMLSVWVSVAWFLLRGADFMRPSALQRMYSLMWLFVIAWLLLLGDTVLQYSIGLAGGYFVVFYFAAIFVALTISYLELLALPTKSAYANIRSRVETATSADSQRATAGSEDDVANDEAAATESTSLLRGDGQRTYSSGYGAHRSNTEATASEDIDSLVYQSLPRPYGNEQPWSGKIPSWTWLVQFLILGPVVIVLLGQVALLMTSALHQTPADGSSALTVYLFVAVLSVLLLAPITPFIHRLPASIPRTLFLVFIGTLLYNLLVFPFSEQAQLKAYFVQSVNLDTGVNQASLTGLTPYVQDIISSLPSAAGQNIVCASPDYTARHGPGAEVLMGRAAPKCSSDGEVGFSGGSVCILGCNERDTSRKIGLVPRLWERHTSVPAAFQSADWELHGGWLRNRRALPGSGNAWLQVHPAMESGMGRFMDGQSGAQ